MINGVSQLVLSGLFHPVVLCRTQTDHAVEPFEIPIGHLGKMETFKRTPMQLFLQGQTT